jgi:hypothetical protein
MLSRLCQPQGDLIQNHICSCFDLCFSLRQPQCNESPRFRLYCGLRTGQLRPHGRHVSRLRVRVHSVHFREHESGGSQEQVRHSGRQSVLVRGLRNGGAVCPEREFGGLHVSVPARCGSGKK